MTTFSLTTRGRPQRSNIQKRAGVRQRNWRETRRKRSRTDWLTDGRDTEKGSRERKKSEPRPICLRQKEPRTINRDERRRRFLRLPRGGGGPRPREVLSPPNPQEGTASPLHQVGRPWDGNGYSTPLIVAQGTPAIAHNTHQIVWSFKLSWQFLPAARGGGRSTSHFFTIQREYMPLLIASAKNAIAYSLREKLCAPKLRIMFMCWPNIGGATPKASAKIKNNVLVLAEHRWRHT